MEVGVADDEGPWRHIQVIVHTRGVGVAPSLGMIQIVEQAAPKHRLGRSFGPGQLEVHLSLFAQSVEFGATVIGSKLERVVKVGPQ
eukprot:477449-Amorphochlora_amoeboformis.AAC.1